MRTKYLVGIILLLNASFAFSQLNILSGVEGGSYNQVANDINKISGNSHKILLSKGSSYTFHNLMMKPQKYDVAFLQGDVMLVGKEQYEGVENVKVLLSLGMEEIHLVTTKSSNINSLKDLSEKFIGIGTKEQGTSITAQVIHSLTGFNLYLVGIPFDDCFDALLSGKIDAFFFVGSAPVSKLNDLDDKYKNEFKLVPIKHQSLTKYYKKTVIKAGTYSWVTEDVETYGINHVMATNIEKETPERVEQLTKLLTAIKENIEKLQKEGHPVWKQVDFKAVCDNYEMHDVAKKVFGLK